MKDFWQKVKSFFKKFWHFVVIGVLTAAIITMIIVMCVCMVPKGKGNGGNGGGGDKGGQLDTPQNVQVVADRVLVWDEVLNAGGGYTVKINDDETTSVTKNYLDLSADSLKTIIVTGNNTISVKANAHGSYTASAYSDPITYELVLTPAEEAAGYVRLVEAIDTITADSEYSVALTVQAKIDDAAEYYQGMSLEALALENVTTAKASFDEKKEAYDTVMETAQTAYTEFLPSLTAATAEIEKAESLTALSDKQEEAESAYTALSTLAKGMLTEDEQTAYDSLATTVEAWEDEIEEAQGEWANVADEFVGNTTDDDAEDNIATAKTWTDKYDAYAKYVQNGIATEYATVTTALEEAQDKIKATVNPIITAVSAFTGEVEKDDLDGYKEYYDDLIVYQEAVEGFGAYATELWTEGEVDLSAKLQTEINAVLAVPADKVADLIVTGYQNGKVRILYQVTNILGKGLVLSANDLPAVSITLNGAATPVTGTVSAVAGKTGIYYYETDWTKPETGKYLTVSYTVGGVSGSEEFREIVDSAYFFPNETGNKALTADGKQLAFNGESGMFFDIYLESDIDISGSLPEIKGMPLVRNFPVENGMSVDMFRYNLAIAYPELVNENSNKLDKVYDVRFVLKHYVGGDAENGERDSQIANARVSHDVYTLDLTETDEYCPIPSTKYHNDVVELFEGDYRFRLVTIAVASPMKGDMNAILSERKKTEFAFTDDASMQSQLGIRITIKSGNDVVGTADLGMKEYTYTLSDIKFYWSRAYFAKHPTEESVTFTGLSYFANYYVLGSAHDDVKAVFRDGPMWELNAPAAIQTVTLTTADRVVALKTTGKNDTFTDMNNISLSRDVMGMMIDGSGEAGGFSINQILADTGSEYSFAGYEALKNDFCDRLIIKGTIDGEEWECVLNLKLGIAHKFTDFVQLCSVAYYRENPTVKENVTFENLTFKGCYGISENAHADVKDIFTESERWTITGLSNSMGLNRACITLNAPAAIDTANSGSWVILIRDSVNGNGKLLTTGAAKYVKYEFYKKETPNTKYTMYLFVNKAGNVEFYKDINADGTPNGAAFVLTNTENGTSSTAGDAGAELSDFKNKLEKMFENDGLTFIGNWVFTDQYIVEGSDEYLYSTPNTTEFNVTENNITKVTSED